MKEFPSIDEVHDMLDEIAEEIPKDFFKELNQGILLLPQHKIHPESRTGDKLYIKGEYHRSITGRQIKMYYGSFERLYQGISRTRLYQKLKDTLLHEFTHHLESLAGEKGLEIKDAR
ncbi:MAG: metallopeptidase family protein, partial [Clostridiaceae bacterium]|nr:metallopeptidase family protein [Clostridiaceae bacterium]